MVRLSRSPVLAPNQGYTSLCWAASLVLAADYQGYALAPAELLGQDVRTQAGLEQFIEGVAGMLGLARARTGYVTTPGRPGKVEALAALPGFSVRLAPRAEANHDAVNRYVAHWIDRDCPVLLRWNPSAAGLEGYGGEHFGVVVEWGAERARLTDSYRGTRGSKCEIMPLPGGSSTHWRGLQAIAVLRA
ncbi:MAG: hypothetical protein Q8P41_18275 [Pseudomonadota bacterium]|nr:hypothetical protein [Pseudomonadota bacterium]